MIDNRYQISEFESKYEQEVQNLENSFVTSSNLFGLIKIERSFEKISYEKYVNERYSDGFILVITDKEDQSKIVGKALFGVKSVDVNKQTLKGVYVHELRISSLCSNPKLLYQRIIEQGLEKASKSHKCEVAYILVDQAQREEKEPILIKELAFENVGDILSGVSLQNNMMKIEQQVGEDLKFREVLPEEAIKLHSESKTSGDFYCKQVYLNEQIKSYVFADDQSKNIYGMSVYLDDKRYSKNFSRFILSAKLLQNNLFIKLFYALVNIFFFTLLYLEKNEEGLLHDDLKYKIVIYLGLNIGICLSFYQTQKAFKKFSGKVGRLFQPIEIESNPQTCVCFENNASQIRVDMDTRCDHFDYFNSKSCFIPYNQNTLTFYAKYIGKNSNNNSLKNLNVQDIKLLSVDPRDF